MAESTETDTPPVRPERRRSKELSAGNTSFGEVPSGIFDN